MESLIFCCDLILPTDVLYSHSSTEWCRASLSVASSDKPTNRANKYPSLHSLTLLTFFHWINLIILVTTSTTCLLLCWAVNEPCFYLTPLYSIGFPFGCILWAWLNPKESFIWVWCMIWWDGICKKFVKCTQNILKLNRNRSVWLFPHGFVIYRHLSREQLMPKFGSWWVTTIFINQPATESYNQTRKCYSFVHPNTDWLVSSFFLYLYLSTPGVRLSIKKSISFPCSFPIRWWWANRIK